jgi:hypothetical protein
MVPWFILCAPVLALLAIWVVYSADLYHRQLELEIDAEAASLAAARDLVDDVLLTELPARQEFVEKHARHEAREVAKRNFVHAHPVCLDPNPDNHHCGELTIGTLLDPFCHDFDASCQAHPDLYHPNRNAVRIALKREGVAASATAFVDRDVVGFKIQGAMSMPGQSIPAIPVTPLALLCDPGTGRECDECWRMKDHEEQKECWAARDARSWEHQIMARRGQDRFRMVRGEGGKHEPHEAKEDESGDGIPEMRITLSTKGQHGQDNSRFALVGVGDLKDAVSQFTTGITCKQLENQNGQLVLGDSATGSTPRNEMDLPRHLLGASELRLLEEQLREILGQPRVWMLYSHTQGSKDSDGAVRVVGFVAARVMAVNFEEHWDKEHRHEYSRLTAVLQPCMLVTATAVTDHTRRDLGPRTLFNPYVCKVRLVE